MESDAQQTSTTPTPKASVTASTRPKSKLTYLLGGVLIILAIIGIGYYLLSTYNSSTNQKGTVDNPYNSSHGYIGSGYYNISGQALYISSQSQLNNASNKQKTTTASQRTTIQTSSASTAPTTTVPLTAPTTTVPLKTAQSSSTTTHTTSSTYTSTVSSSTSSTTTILSNANSSSLSLNNSLITKEQAIILFNGVTFPTIKDANGDYSGGSYIISSNLTGSGVQSSGVFPGINWTTTKFITVSIQNFSKGVDSREVIVSTKNASSMYNYDLSSIANASSLQGAEKINGTKNGVTYIILYEPAYDVYALLAWKNDIFVYFYDDAAVDGINATINTTTLSDTITEDIQ